MFVFFRVESLVLPQTVEGVSTVFDRIETAALLSLTTFCQRVTNASHDVVAAGINLEKLIDLPNTLIELISDGNGDRAGPVDDFDAISEALDDCVRLLTPVPSDDVGFRIFCTEANIAWLTISYAKELGAQGGPCPRRQELDLSRVVIGRVPAGRKFVVSHAWDSAFHISPSGFKLSRLKAALEQLGADDDPTVEDAVFIE